ncbi:hypothetical protein SOV_38210 [Sporomusa ovata DSM 2662]|nr:hypothetical protein SOV_3c00840 [Sporomusa ovata DSM 2662]
MPRIARKKSKSGIYHVIVRGIKHKFSSEIHLLRIMDINVFLSKIIP